MVRGFFTKPRDPLEAIEYVLLSEPTSR
jgi:hypothetical protein